MSSPLSPLPAGFAATVAALHQVAELVVAPARKPDNEIALMPTPGGFGTPEFEFDGARRQVRVEGTEVVQTVGDGQRRAPLTSLAEAGRAVTELLPADADLSQDPLALDADAAAVLAGWYEFGAAVLSAFAAAAAGDAATEPILWPEHFDVAIELGDEAAGERATYGFSPGDENHAEPYAYVAPWRPGVEGELWNAAGFGGAELGYEELLGAAEPQAAAADFFAVRRQALAA
ncbi:MAG TPA: hypothetical protein VFJ57_08310 [Solirubrobacterales bacterium]|nr:hypothetical protein [Solirubrobacterales bacterium]